MVECIYAGCEWVNQEGFFRVLNTPTVDHPWYGKIVCMDWDAFCTKCRDENKYDLLQNQLEEIRRRVEIDPDIQKRKEKTTFELSQLSYEQLYCILLI